MAGDKCIETFQNDPLKNLTDGAKKADWAIVRRVRVIPARLVLCDKTG
jgi:S-adenosylmethionine:tRNA-ribosyltransferase-isomerase (queuine synthetase)